jgi:hypothetical protein
MASAVARLGATRAPCGQFRPFGFCRPPFPSWRRSRPPSAPDPTRARMTSLVIGLPPDCQAHSALRYSMTLSCSRWTQPASTARMKCQGATGPYATLAVLVQSGGLKKAGRPASTDAGMPGNRTDRSSDERSGDPRAPSGTWCRISTFDFPNITPTLPALRPDEALARLGVRRLAGRHPRRSGTPGSPGPRPGREPQAHAPPRHYG